MKKLFTLVLGALVALSAVAAPVSFRKAGKKELTKETVLNHVKKVVPKAPAQLNGETISIEANNLEIDLSYFDLYLEYMNYGVLFALGSNDEWSVEATLFTEDENYFTTYSTADESINLEVTDAESNTIELNVSAAELKQTAKGNQFTATATDEVGNTYNINLTFFAPDEPKDTVVIDFADEAEVSYYGDTKDYYIFVGNDNYLAQLDIFTETLEGTYTTDDFDSHYTGLYRIVDGDTTSVGALFASSAEITLTDGVYSIAAEFFAADSVLYQLNIHYTKPTASETVTLDTEDASILDYTATVGMYQVVAAPADSSYVLYITPVADQLEGTFTHLDLSGTYSFIKTENDLVTIAEAEFTAVIEDNKLKLEGWILGVNGVKYEFVIKTVALSEGIENIVLTEKAQKVAVDGVVYIIRDNKLFNLQGAQVR